jgi:hypothetical protein
VRDQVSHAYKIKGKMTLLHILIIWFSERRREDKFWTELLQVFPEFLHGCNSLQPSELLILPLATIFDFDCHISTN